MTHTTITDQRERAGAKNQLHYLLRRTRATELSPAVLESIAQIDGSVVLDRDSLSTRYELLFDREIPPQSMPILCGLTEDRYVSTCLDGRAFGDTTSAATLPDRVSEAIEVLRISTLSSYEDKRISTGALLFGTLPDACHKLPSRPSDALPYSSELTSIAAFTESATDCGRSH